MRVGFVVVALWLGLATTAFGAAPALLVMGDSLSAAYGMAVDQGWVALLARRLADRGSSLRVVNASVSGETSAGGLSRVPAELARIRPQLVILELGANDGLRGLPLTQMRANLLEITRLAQRSGARVLLLGMRIPPNYGPVYADDFHASFAAVAKQTRSALLPFFLEGVALKPDLIQADGLHPNAAAQAVLLDTVWPALQPMLTSGTASAPARARAPSAATP